MNYLKWRAKLFKERRNLATKRGDWMILDREEDLKKFEEKFLNDGSTKNQNMIALFAYYEGMMDEYRNRIRKEREERETGRLCTLKEFAKRGENIHTINVGIETVAEMYEKFWKDVRGLEFYSYVGMIHPEYSDKERMDKSDRLQDICEELGIHPCAAFVLKDQKGGKG